MVFAWRLAAIRRQNALVTLPSSQWHRPAPSRHLANPVALRNLGVGSSPIGSTHRRHQHSEAQSALRQDVPPVSDAYSASGRDRRDARRSWRTYDWKTTFRLPTPLPQHVSRENNLRGSTSAVAKRKRAKKAREAQMAGSSSDTPLAFGDLAGATLADLNSDSSVFPPSSSIENVAILKACVSTNLLTRALRIFADIREATSKRIDPSDFARLPKGGAAPLKLRARWRALNPVGRETYDLIIAAMLKRSNAEEGAQDVHRWLDEAWALFREMQTGMRHDSEHSHAGASHSHPYLPDPTPGASTFAVMARGIVKISQTHSFLDLGNTGLAELIAEGYKSNISFDEAFDFLAHQVPGDGAGDELSAQLIARKLVSAAVHSSNDSARQALERAEKRLINAQTAAEEASKQKTTEPDSLASGPFEDPRDGLPSLKPVQSASKYSGDGSQDAKPVNLTLLQRDLKVVDQARSATSDNEERQRWLEETALDSARQRLQIAAEHLDELGVRQDALLNQDRTLQKWMWEWTQKLSATLKDDISRIVRESESSPNWEGRIILGSQKQFEGHIAPFLRLMTPDKLALITVLEVMRLQGSGGVSDGMKTTRTLISLGKAVEAEHYVGVIRQHPEIYSKVKRLNEMVSNQRATDSIARQEARRLLKANQYGPLEWTQTIRARVGSYLVGHLMKIATIRREARDRDGQLWSEEHPAMYATYQYLQGKKLGIIKLHDHVAQRLDKDRVGEILSPRLLPMLVKPRLWLKDDQGGYLTSKSSMMRFKESAEQASYLKAACDDENRLETVMCGLDALGETAWKINRDVLGVMTEVWNSGSDVADMPPLIDESWGRPTRPADYDTNVAAKAKFLNEEKLGKMKRAAIHSQRCDVNYKLEIARAYLGETFYFPHNIDFRGRAYPMPVHLNHIGDDLCRGLLLFSKGKPLGQSGFRWLRIHLANVYGYDKASFEERVQFAEDHMADIEDAVKNPLNGKRWWLGADDPWQCLATCHEIWLATNHPEGPEKFVSHLPVHQDGTCNGLQHYAALGGDLAGAKQVNLAGGDRPSDVYTAVADLVIADLEHEASKPKGDPMAALLKDKVTRKVVKQTVMTTVYGVTFIGAKNQVARQLVARGDIPADQIYAASLYLARRILSSIGNLFAGAQRIQWWLSESARLIAKSIPAERLDYALNEADEANPRPLASRLALEQMTSVIWTSPVGLPIVQPYRKTKKAQVSTALQTVFLKDPKANTEVSAQKQSSAFPPNFIHSLDATHMLLTALECRDAGLTFASVHDSYWTHACDVETMSELIRDTFIRLHSQDILPRLREEFLERYKGHKVPVVTAQDALTKRLRQQAKEAVAARKSAELSGVEAPTLTVELDPKDVEGFFVRAGEGARDAKARERQALADEDAEQALQEDIDADEAALSSDIEGEESAEVDELPDDFLDEGDGDAAPTAAKSKRQTAQSYLASFVELSTILPPIPAKGRFDVEEIRESKYFFS
ncbi:unnamed protein product [Parajaminaea phylloscopi]